MEGIFLSSPLFGGQLAEELRTHDPSRSQSPGLATKPQVFEPLSPFAVNVLSGPLQDQFNSWIGVHTGVVPGKVKSIPCLCVHSFNNDLLSTYCEPYFMLSSGDITKSKILKQGSGFQEATDN